MDVPGEFCLLCELTWSGVARGLMVYVHTMCFVYSIQLF